MPQGAFRNLAATIAIFLVGVGAGYASARLVDTAVLVGLLKEMWVVQAVLATAVVSLIYRLQSDSSVVGHLSALQRSRLNAVVKVKSFRLWMLFLAIALAAVVARFATIVPGARLQEWFAASALALMLASTLYCLYLPGMWNELRQFVTALSAEKEAAERRARELERLS